jgi:putative addiction module killer protein
MIRIAITAEAFDTVATLPPSTVGFEREPPPPDDRREPCAGVSMRIRSRVLTFVWSSRFKAWIDGVGDPKMRARIAARLRRASLGNFGDCASVGEGLSEMRIDVGPGYRVYFIGEGRDVCRLLAGGDKSTQDRDIEQAKAMARKVKEERDR